MSDYTPITDQDVEDAWVLAQEHHNDNGDLHERKTFRRWLAAHDAEVRADEQEKAILSALVDAFKIMRANTDALSRIIYDMDGEPSQNFGPRVVAHLIEAVDTAADNAAWERGAAARGEQQ